MTKQIENRIIADARKECPNNPFMQFGFEAEEHDIAFLQLAVDCQIRILERICDKHSESKLMSDELAIGYALRDQLNEAIDYYMPVYGDSGDNWDDMPNPWSD